MMLLGATIVTISVVSLSSRYILVELGEQNQSNNTDIKTKTNNNIPQLFMQGKN